MQGIMDGEIMTMEQFRVEELIVAYFRSLILRTFCANAILNVSGTQFHAPLSGP